MSKARKGVVLAGGTGSRLAPITRATSKQLLPVYDKPMIYFPLATMMLAGVREILIITTPQDQLAFQRLLGEGHQWGLRLSYATQQRPEGIAQALLIAETFLAGSPVCLALGDNLFHGHRLAELLHVASDQVQGATIFAYRVSEPERYGVIGFDSAGVACSIEEKPSNPASHFAVTGLYFYDADCVALARTLRPSTRGELEITDLNRLYMERDALQVSIMDRGFAWFDAGTHEALLEAANFIHTLQMRQGVQIACLEEIAWRNGWISAASLITAADRHASSSYGRYLRNLPCEVGTASPLNQ